MVQQRQNNVHKAAKIVEDKPDMKQQSTESYTLIRPAGRMETLHRLFYDLSIQSNIIIAAAYGHERKCLLEAPLLFTVLRIVITQHPALGVVMSSEPSKGKKGSHRTWEARLKTINMSDCVSFVDGYDDSSQGLQQILEKTHNEWFGNDDKTKPLWRLVAINHAHVLFVFNHFIGDGMSGVIFHRSLVSALNKVSKDNEDGLNFSTNPTSFMVSTSSAPLSPETSELLQAHFSYYMVLYSALIFVYVVVLRSFLPQTY